MKPSHIDVFVNQKSGRYKVLFWGYADGHIMDWRGCNFRTVTIYGQPRSGYERIEDAQGFLTALKADPDRLARERAMAKMTAGSFLGDSTIWQL